LVFSLDSRLLLRGEGTVRVAGVVVKDTLGGMPDDVCRVVLFDPTKELVRLLLLPALLLLLLSF
jgi:hypothetical protein